MMDVPNSYDRTAMIVTMTTAMVGNYGRGFAMIVTMTMMVWMKLGLLLVMVATMIVLTFVIVMTVAMTVWGSL